MSARRSVRLRAASASITAMLALASCGSGDSDADAATATTDAPAAAPTTALPTTTALATTTSISVTTTSAPTTSGVPVEPPIVLDEAGAALVSGQRYRYEIHGTTFEFDGVDGWLASKSGNSFFAFVPGKQPVEAFVSMMRLHDARPSAGLDQADRTGLAVPVDPFATSSDVSSDLGSPNVDAVRDLPADWIGYLDGLPGIDVASRGPGRLGRFDGDLASFVVSGLPEMPAAMCATPSDSRCITFAVELVASYYYSENDEVTLVVTEAGGVPYEFSTGINQRNGVDPASIDELDRLVESMELVE